MSEESIVRFVLDPKNPPGLSAETKARLEAMTDEDVEAAASSDPDAQPLSDEQLEAMAIQALRKRLGLTQQAFADCYRIPLGTLRDWEQGRARPDQAARAYLTVIGHNPQAVEEALGAA